MYEKIMRISNFVYLYGLLLMGFAIYISADHSVVATSLMGMGVVAFLFGGRHFWSLEEEKIKQEILRTTRSIMDNMDYSNKHSLLKNIVESDYSYASSSTVSRKDTQHKCMGILEALVGTDHYTYQLVAAL